ncbi:hypothetical protein GCM10027202_27610 [Microvirgula curvata]|nr:lipoprotein-anchoring transpeptidase ErfK/SrfK [Microvirgula sp. AG722]
MPMFTPIRRSLFTLVLLGASAVAAPSRAAPVPDVQVSETGYHVVINLPQTRLFLYRDGKLDTIYPVAVGKTLTQTPAGEYWVTGIYHNPAWHVPKSIQAEMKKNGRTVQTVVPAGPNNPLGKVFVRFGEPRLGLGIHGTNAPSSVPGFRSHGCVRMRNDDVLTLARTVSTDVPVSVINQSVIMNTDARGDLWLTSYPDIYKTATTGPAEVTAAAEKWGSEHNRKVDGRLVKAVLGKRTGQPVCVTCSGSRPEVAQAGLAPVHWLSGSAQTDPSPLF